MAEGGDRSNKINETQNTRGQSKSENVGNGGGSDPSKFYLS